MTGDAHATTRRFRVRVDGRLSRGFADVLDGIEQLDEPGGTVLVGEFVDDAHLHGVLDHLRALAIGIQSLALDPSPESAEHREDTT